MQSTAYSTKAFCTWLSGSNSKHLDSSTVWSAVNFLHDIVASKIHNKAYIIIVHTYNYTKVPLLDVFLFQNRYSFFQA